MNQFYQSFIDTAKHLASQRGLHWELEHDQAGKISHEYQWNLDALAGLPSRSTRLASLTPFEKGREVLNQILTDHSLPRVDATIMTEQWQDLYKAVLISEVLVKRNTPRHALDNVGRYIRLFALCCPHREPWKIGPEDVQLAYNVALQIGGSGKHALNLTMVIRHVMDGLHLADKAPLARFCVPYPSINAQEAQKNVKRQKAKEGNSGRADAFRSELQERKRAGGLPEEKAFWELVRIAFTETPKTFSDVIRFAQVKLGIVTGFRIGENVSLPADWERWREYPSTDGRPAGAKGGISRSLMIRHFAEKQTSVVGQNGIVLYENAQHVPPDYEEVVLKTLQGVANATWAMRERLRQQAETGRLFPEFLENTLIPVWDAYTRVSGSINLANEPLPAVLVAKYRKTCDMQILDEMRAQQIAALGRSGLHERCRQYWWRHEKSGGITIRREDGRELTDTIDHKSAFIRVAELEAFVRKALPTKLPDLMPFQLADGGSVYPHDMLFLMPVRATVENQHGGILDLNRYFSFAPSSREDLQRHLGLADDNLFARYGQTEDDKRYKILSHSLRHLQNAELFRLGVADTIITKRFNRRSVAQSYEYDHRSLAEDLESIGLPEEAVDRLGSSAQDALRLIITGKVSGPIVDEFRRVQLEQGDNAAYDFLDAEADGLHVTPYGLCLNSFLVDPCPKHLECYNGCRHLGRTTVPEEQRNLKKLRDKMKRAVERIEAVPSKSRTTGWQNQLKHAASRLENIEKALLAEPGTKPFPDGPDLYQPISSKSGTTILDGKASNAAR